MHDSTGVHTQESIDLSHPLGIAGGQVVVYGDHMDTFTGQAVQIHR